MKVFLKNLLPEIIWNQLSRLNNNFCRSILNISNRCRVNISLVSDYYSPLPVVSKIETNMEKWFKPSKLVGINYDINTMKDLLKSLGSQYADEYKKLPSYSENIEKGYGPGYTAFDSMILYFMVRRIKPKNYIEVGSGLSTYYFSLAAKRNEEEGYPSQITCIEPYPLKALYTISSNIAIIKKEVQDIEASFFAQLEPGDILFIDSSHILKIDGDVPYLYLEVIPRLKKGVIIHIHDIPFPFNVPFPPKYWIFNRTWPVFWNEAMLLQAFLSHNDAYRILLSPPLVRFYDENFLRSNMPGYEPISQNTDTFSSIWIERIL